MIQHIIDAATTVNIAAVVLNSEERIEAQLNRITRAEANPIMLISWDINTNLVFDINGFLENPSADIVALLVQKPDDTSDDEAKITTDTMGSLFQQFIQQLYNDLIKFQKSSTSAITSATYKNVPKYGAGKHAGILAKWTMRNDISVCTNG